MFSQVEFRLTTATSVLWWKVWTERVDVLAFATMSSPRCYVIAHVLRGAVVPLSKHGRAQRRHGTDKTVKKKEKKQGYD